MDEERQSSVSLECPAYDLFGIHSITGLNSKGDRKQMVLALYVLDTFP